ncbi:hypothetical protein [Chryseobacterium indoltheticum]|uniref:Uncharacterized protein n=1 Tax=Chryseobacterium indoltheticum TaxID=254 RepID=A0A381F5N3_9FLAO|nr:hypothetical protein [Chryseobacterium indoltheticum]SIQ60644.1 hypothetical protein SAMN05421682_106221 [Chryseobacterium indoltheticum]SUX41422.1 Uncharacterised protein [Chryseobacterium indoltheticum]
MQRSKIIVKGFKFYLYGSVNPWVLLASGKLEFVDDPKLGKVGVSQANWYTAMASKRRS